MDAGTGISAFTTNTAQPTRIWCFSFTPNSRVVYLFSTSCGSDTNNSFLTGWSGATIGSMGASAYGQYYNGKMREILIYSTTINTTQRQQIEGYLAWKWGLQSSLPTTHPYYSASSLPSTHPFYRLPPATPSFVNPNIIPGCTLWLDATDPNGNGIIPTNGSSISTWVDKSGNGNNATAISTAPTFQTNILNRSPGISFNSSAMSAGNIATGTNFSIFLVVRYTSIGPISLGFWKSQYGSFMSFSGRTIVAGATTGTDYGTALMQLNQLLDTNTHMQYGVLTSDTVSVNSSLVTSIDGNVSNFSSTAGPNISTEAQPFTVGGLVESGSPYYQMTGYIHEIVYYKSSLSLSQCQQIEGYLAWKWGLQSNLPSTHPYKKFAP